GTGSSSASRSASHSRAAAPWHLGQCRLRQLVGDDGMATCFAFAARNVPSERRRAAALDGRHHLQLPEAHVAAIGLTPSGAVVAEDIRNLQSWTGHEGRGLLGRLVLLVLLGQLIERA